MDLTLLDAELRRDEGVRNTIYPDSNGIPTTGVGHNCQAHPLPREWTMPLTDEQIDQLLNHDLQVTFAGLDLHLPWWRNLDEVRQRCVANMAFNMGVDGLLAFHHGLADLQTGDYDKAADDFKNSLWYHQVGERAIRICNAIKTGEF